MSVLADLFKDLLCPEWRTEIDDPHAPVGEYAPYSNNADVGDKIFSYATAYGTPSSDSITCRSQGAALVDMDKAPPHDDGPVKLYKIYGTLASPTDTTIDVEDIEEIATRKIEGAYFPVSEAQAADIDKENAARTAEIAALEPTPQPDREPMYLPGVEPPEPEPEIDHTNDFTHSLPPLPDDSPVSEYQYGTTDIAGIEDMDFDNSADESEPDSGIDVDV